MLPDNILQSDVLDLVFENRNKAYGAYVLRKNYPQRLSVALAAMAGFVVLFIFIQFEMKPANNNAPAPVIDSIQVAPVQLLPEKTNKPLIKNISKPVKQFATIKDLVPVIAKNNIIDTMPTVEQLNNSQIGSQNIKSAVLLSPQAVSQPSNGNANTGEAKTDEPDTFKTAEIMPQFPGGPEALQKFLIRNIKQPDDLNADETLVVKAKFVVDADGSISGIEILQSGRNDLDADVIKVLHKMPKWIPGMQNGKNIAVYFQLPVTFVGTEQ
jgi:periplasmic protein TonB